MRIYLERFLAAVCVTAVFFLTVYAAVPLKGQRVIYDNVIRLHILANSDSERDQRLKQTVRDRISEVASSLYLDCASVGQAEEITNQNLPLLYETARETVDRSGFCYPVTIETGYEDYPTRKYSDFTFPAGNYYSLRIKIGEARGKNWWCVLFPPLCVTSAISAGSADIQKLANAGFSNESIHILREADSGRYAVKFKTAELLRKWFQNKGGR